MQKFLTAFFIICTASYAFAQTDQTAIISVADAKPGSVVQMNTYVGTVGYYATSNIPAERSGVVANVSAEEGAAVKSGAVLLTINADVLKQSIAAANARYEQEKLNLEKLGRDYERSRVLFSENATTEQRYLDSGTARLVQEHEVAYALASLNILKEDDRRSSVRAPYDGLILKRHVNKGDWVSIGSTVYEIALRRLEVTVNIPQAVIQLVNPGAKVVISIEQGKYNGAVRAVIPSGDVTSRTFPVKIDIDYNEKLYGGMDARVSIPIGERKEALIIPIDSIVRRANADCVFIISDNKAVLMPVRIIGYEGTNAGIEPDSRIRQVITTGNERLSEGQTVSITQVK